MIPLTLNLRNFMSYTDVHEPLRFDGLHVAVLTGDPVKKQLLVRRLAKAPTVEEQLAVANEFDPVDAVANWRRAEGVEPAAEDAARISCGSSDRRGRDAVAPPTISSARGEVRGSHAARNRCRP